MVLLGVLALEAHAGRRLGGERPAHLRAAARFVAVAAPEPLQELDQPFVRDIARGGDDDVAARVHRTVIARDRAAADG